MPVTLSLGELLRQKEEYDDKYDSQDQMTESVRASYRALLREIEKAGKRAQGRFSFLEKTAGPAGQLSLFV